jgi:hypothetical protein
MPTLAGASRLGCRIFTKPATTPAEEAPNELVDGQRRRVAVLGQEGHVMLVGPELRLVGDGDAAGVATEVLEDVLGATERARENRFGDAERGLDEAFGRARAGVAGQSSMREKSRCRTPRSAPWSPCKQLTSRLSPSPKSNRGHRFVWFNSKRVLPSTDRAGLERRPARDRTVCGHSDADSTPHRRGSARPPSSQRARATGRICVAPSRHGRCKSRYVTPIGKER